MATYTKETLSHAAQGQPIPLGTAYTNIHLTPVANTVFDEVWLYATNVASATRTVTVRIGGVGLINFSVEPTSGLLLVLPGLLIRGNNTAGTLVEGFASAASEVYVHGYINREDRT